jgi:hypothetical protein
VPGVGDETHRSPHTIFPSNCRRATKHNNRSAMRDATPRRSENEARRTIPGFTVGGRSNVARHEARSPGATKHTSSAGQSEARAPHSPWHLCFLLHSMFWRLLPADRGRHARPCTRVRAPTAAVARLFGGNWPSDAPISAVQRLPRSRDGPRHPPAWTWHQQTARGTSSQHVAEHSQHVFSMPSGRCENLAECARYADIFPARQAPAGMPSMSAHNTARCLAWPRPVVGLIATAPRECCPGRHGRSPDGNCSRRPLWT